MCNIPSIEFNCMPIGELSDIIDASKILNGYCDENIPKNEDDYGYIPDLR